jgi:hypothetical protein
MTDYGCTFSSPRPEAWVPAGQPCPKITGTYRNAGESDGQSSTSGIANEFGIRGSDRVHLTLDGQTLRLFGLSGESPCGEALAQLACTEEGWEWSNTSWTFAEGVAVSHSTLTLSLTQEGDLLVKVHMRGGGVWGFIPVAGSDTRYQLHRRIE